MPTRAPCPSEICAAWATSSFSSRTGRRGDSPRGTSPPRGAGDGSWTSLYYPGEAALGLMMLYEVEDDDAQRIRWYRGASRAIRYLYEVRKDLPLAKVEPDHWALIATERLLGAVRQDTSRRLQLVPEGGPRGRRLPGDEGTGPVPRGQGLPAHGAGARRTREAPGLPGLQREHLLH